MKARLATKSIALKAGIVGTLSGGVFHKPRSYCPAAAIISLIAAVYSPDGTTASCLAYADNKTEFTHAVVSK
jgi:hypothetical protein